MRRIPGFSGGALERIYRGSPVWLQNLAVTTWGLAWHHRRFGGRFREYVDEFVARERFSSGEWTEYQTRELSALLLRCYRQVPHYRECFSRQGLGEAELSKFTLSDLARLPILSREIIRAKPRALLATDVSERQVYVITTSGSTGTPVPVYMTPDVHRRVSAAYEARCRLWAGVNHHMSRAMIGGRVVVPHSCEEPPFFRYNWWERQIYFSAFHVAPQNVRSYVDTLNRYRPDYLVGYASSHYFLARLIEEQGLPVHSPRCVIVSSEKLTEEMRDTLERVYRCEVFDAYSGVEACCWGSECEHHRMHLSPDVGIVEVLRANGEPAAEGEDGELVATGLLNSVQPLIRYRTGDIVRLSNEPCPCGRAMPIVQELVGRLEDALVTPDGREITRLGLFRNLPMVREGQIIQEGVSEFTIRVVAPHGLQEPDRRLILSLMEQRLGKVRVRIEEVQSIERTQRGKFRTVICRVSNEERKRLRMGAVHV